MADIGCQVRVQRRSLQEHMDTNMREHLWHAVNAFRHRQSLIVADVSTLMREIRTLKQNTAAELGVRITWRVLHDEFLRSLSSRQVGFDVSAAPLPSSSSAASSSSSSSSVHSLFSDRYTDAHGVVWRALMEVRPAKPGKVGLFVMPSRPVLEPRCVNMRVGVCGQNSARTSSFTHVFREPVGQGYAEFVDFSDIAALPEIEVDVSICPVL